MLYTWRWPIIIFKRKRCKKKLCSVQVLCNTGNERLNTLHCVYFNISLPYFNLHNLPVLFWQQQKIRAKKKKKNTLFVFSFSSLPLTPFECRLLPDTFPGLWRSLCPTSQSSSAKVHQADLSTQVRITLSAFNCAQPAAYNHHVLFLFNCSWFHVSLVWVSHPVFPVARNLRHRGILPISWAHSLLQTTVPQTPGRSCSLRR